VPNGEYNSDSSNSYTRFQAEDEFVGFGDYNNDRDAESEPGSDASAANPFEEDEEEL
jgi:hypothetical protein